MEQTRSGSHRLGYTQGGQDATCTLGSVIEKIWLCFIRLSCSDWHKLRRGSDGPIGIRRGAGTDYPLEAFATDVIEQMDALKVDKCALVGHSLGALVSSMVAQRQPDRVDRVLLEEMPVPRRVRQDPPPMRTYVDGKGTPMVPGRRVGAIGLPTLTGDVSVMP